MIAPLTAVAAPAAATSGVRIERGASAPQSAEIAKVNKEIEDFQSTHADDVGAIDAYVFKLTGQHVNVTSNRFSGTLTGTEAQKYTSVGASAGQNQDIIRPMGGIRPYTVQVYTVPLLGPPHQVRVVGNWNFPDDWIGTGAPVDLASLSWTNVPGCMQYYNFSSSTYKYDNTSTNRGYLQNSNLPAHAPIWAIQDVTSGFAAYADHGYVSVDFWDACGGPAKQNMAAEFHYDANQGQSSVTASAGWGFLSVSFGGSGMSRLEGTAPLYFHD